MKRILYVFWFLLISFVVTGVLFLFRPNQLVAVSNYMGQVWGMNFDPLPLDQGRIWVAFTFSYMVLVVGLAYLALRDPINGHLFLILLALGKLSSSLTALGFYFVDRAALLYLATFIIDGAIVITLLICMHYLSLYREQEQV